MGRQEAAVAEAEAGAVEAAAVMLDRHDAHFPAVVLVHRIAEPLLGRRRPRAVLCGEAGEQHATGDTWFQQRAMIIRSLCLKTTLPMQILAWRRWKRRMFSEMLEF